MDEAVQYLKEFREKIDTYLFLGYSPPDTYAGGEGSKKMRKALKDPEFQRLRDTIMDMEPRALTILEKCGINRYIVYPFYGSNATMKFTLFELVWRNLTPHKVKKEFFLDTIDKAIRILQPHGAEGMIFVVSKDTEVYNVVEEAADQRQLLVKIADLHTDIKEVLQLIESSEFVVIDLTVPHPDVYFEAGYAHAVSAPVYIAKKGTEINFNFAEELLIFETKYDLRRKVCERLDRLKREKRQDPGPDTSFWTPPTE